MVEILVWMQTIMIGINTFALLSIGGLYLKAVTKDAKGGSI